MYTLIRLLLSALILISPFTTAVGQEQKAAASVGEGSTVTASARAGRVRLTAPPSVVQIRLEVYDESGRKLFDNDLRGGNVLDWHLQDGQAARLAEGRYLCVVTVKNLSGKLTQKIGAVKITDQQVSVEPVEASQLTAQQAEAVGPLDDDSSMTMLKEADPQTTTVIAHNGEEGQITRGKGALSFRLGDFYSGKDTEQMRLSEEGNLGIGVADPKAKLDVDGFIRATQGIVFPDGSIQFSASKKTYGPQSAGPGQFARHPQSGQEHFETAAAGTGTQNFIAKWTETGGVGTLGNSILFDNGTNVGIGTTSPAKKLDVRGGQIALDNGRFLYSRRTNGQFQEAFGIDSNDDIIFNRNSLVPGVDLDAPKASSALIFGAGAGKFLDIRNSANVVMLRVWEATGNVGIGNSNPTARLDVGGNINTSSQYNIGGNRVLSVAGTNNLFAGVNAGISNTTGNLNSFFGNDAGYWNTEGVFNSFFGWAAGQSNTTGHSNSFFGTGAGRKNTTGGGNSFFGTGAGRDNETGVANSFFGSGAGTYNTKGDLNSFFGSSAGSDNTEGRLNSFFGAGAGGRNTEGRYNSFFGGEAGPYNITGNSNSFFGYAVGGYNTTGNLNSFFGYAAGQSNTSECCNTFIGSWSNGAAGITNATAIGYRAQVTQSNSLVLGGITGFNNGVSVNVGIGTTAPADHLHVAGDVRIAGCVKNGAGTVLFGTCSSDLRMKKGITPFSSVIDKLIRLRPVHFYWKADEYPAKRFGVDQSYGLIAQEVEEVLPEMVGEDESGYKVVNYSKLPLLMLQAIKDLKDENDVLKQKLQQRDAALGRHNAEQDARLRALEQKIEQKAVKSSNRRSGRK